MVKRQQKKYARKSLTHSVHYENIKGNLNSNINSNIQKAQTQSQSQAKKEKKNSKINELKQDYDPTILTDIIGMWKQHLTEIYGKPSIAKLETLLANFRLINGRSPFTIFRDELIAQRKKEKSEKIARGEKVEEKYLSNRENRDNFGNNNINDILLWNEVKPEIKEEYSKKSKRDKKMFKIECYLIKTVLFLGYNSFDKNFEEGPQVIYKVEKYIEIYEKLMNNKDIDHDTEKDLEKDFDELSEIKKNVFNEKYNTLLQKRKEAQDFVTLNVKEVFNILNDTENEEWARNKNQKKYRKNKKKNKSELNKEWSGLEISEKDQYYQARETVKSMDEIYYMTNALMNREYIDAPYSADKLFYLDLKTNFHCCKDLQASKALNLWNNCPGDLKELYNQKFIRLNLEYKYMKLIKDTIIKKTYKEIREPLDELQIACTVLNLKYPTKLFTKELLKNEKVSISNKDKKQIDGVIRKNEKVQFQNFKKQYMFTIHRKKYAPVEIFAREHTGIVKKKMRAQKIKFFNAAGILYHNLNEKDKKIYEKKCQELNKILVNQNKEIKENGYCKRGKYDWYFRSKYDKIPKNPEYILPDEEGNKDLQNQIENEEEKQDENKENIHPNKTLVKNDQKIKKEDKEKLDNLFTSFINTNNLDKLKEFYNFVQTVLQSNGIKGEPTPEKIPGTNNKKENKATRNKKSERSIYRKICREMAKEEENKINAVNGNKILEDNNKEKEVKENNDKLEGLNFERKSQIENKVIKLSKNSAFKNGMGSEIKAQIIPTELKENGNNNGSNFIYQKFVPKIIEIINDKDKILNNNNRPESNKNNIEEINTVKKPEIKKEILGNNNNNNAKQKEKGIYIDIKFSIQTRNQTRIKDKVTPQEKKITEIISNKTKDNKENEDKEDINEMNGINTSNKELNAKSKDTKNQKLLNKKRKRSVKKFSISKDKRENGNNKIIKDENSENVKPCENKVVINGMLNIERKTYFVNGRSKPTERINDTVVGTWKRRIYRNKK